MNKKNIIIIISILVVGLIIAGLYGTFATSSTVSGSGNTYTITLTGSSEEVVVPANGNKTVVYQVTNTTKGTVQYAIAYTGTNISVKIYSDSTDEESGLIDYGQNKFVKLYIENSGSSDSTASLKAILGYENGGEIDSLIPSGYSIVSESYTSPVPLVTYIRNLYVNGNPELITQSTSNDKYYYTNETVGLMNYGLNSLGNFITDTESLKNGTAGNIRYYGENPGNYIDIGDRDGSGNVIPWRIIGLMKDVQLVDEDGKIKTQDLIKVARYEVLSSGLKWDEDSSNDWHNSSLQQYLNGDYYNQFSDTVKGKIAKVEWNLGGWITAEGLYPNDIYKYERFYSKCSSCTYDTVWNGNIALMYPSDYSYASNLKICGNDIVTYYNDTINCVDTNWLFNGNFHWTLMPYLNNSSHVWYLHSNGTFGGNGANSSLESMVVPVLYLRPDLVVEMGDGSSSENAFVVK